MIHSIENEHLKLSVKSFGCEITSIKSKNTEYEFMWQGNPQIWSGQAPILFPIIGRLIDDKYIFDGKEYTMEKHGFARRNEWEFITGDKNSMTFRLTDNENTRTMYPFSFELRVTFTLNENTLKVKYEVENKTDGTMYFSLGAHPAFNCEIGDKLTFSKNEELKTEKIDLVRSLRLPGKFSFPQDNGTITITKDIFNEDALILSSFESDSLTLHSDNNSRKIKFTFGNAPYLGIWAKPGASYVCIEPWYGVNDSLEKKDDFSKKDAINAPGKNETFVFEWTAKFSE